MSNATAAEGIVEFIDARLRTDEARSESAAKFYTPPPIFSKVRLGVRLPDGQSVLQTPDGKYVGMIDSKFRWLFTDWDDPAMHLGTARRIRALITGSEWDATPEERSKGLRELAAQWSSHPDYRQEWAS